MVTRTPPQTGYFSDAALHLHMLPNGTYMPRFNEALVMRGITAEQALEASHLLAQLAEYLNDGTNRGNSEAASLRKTET